MICKVFFISTVYNLQLSCPRCLVNCNFSVWLTFNHSFNRFYDSELQTNQERTFIISVPSDKGTIFSHSRIKIYTHPSTLQHHHHTALKANMQLTALVRNPPLPGVTFTHMLKPLLCNKTV